MSSKYRLLLIAILALLVYVSQISVQGMSPGEVTPDQAKLARSALPDGTDGVQNLDVSNAVLSFTQQASTCPGDFDGNGMVNIADFLLFTGVFGTSADDANYNALMDMDGNGEIGIADFLLFTGVFGTTCEKPPPTSDRAVLVALYNATDGPNWRNNTNWLTDAPLGEWYGVDTDASGRVVGLSLAGVWRGIASPSPPHGLAGSIPPELGDLTNLRSLDLSVNTLYGPIPPELGKLANLTDLDLRVNNLSGPIPPEFGNLASLEELNLYGNTLSGPIPPELGKLANLRRLVLPSNRFSGPIPLELGKLANLTDLDLGGNNLSGEIPPELADLGNLRDLWLSSNNLSGPIPLELGKLANLQELFLFANAFSGPIPSELGKLANLRRLGLHRNHLTGLIPPELGNLVRMYEMHLSFNNLSGSVPPELGNLVNLRSLSLNSNNLEGAIPHTFLRLSPDRLNWDCGVVNLCVPGTSEFNDWLGGANTDSGPRCNASDRAVLVDLFNATNGREWSQSTGWLTDASLEEWHGVRTDLLGRVTALDLSNNSLQGGLPGKVGLLSHATEIRINDNTLVGRLPLSLTRLTLGEFHYNGTQLCEPKEGGFTGWLNGVASHRGTSVACEALTDRDRLSAMYHMTDGAGWRNSQNWLSTRPLDQWYGVELDEQGRVVGLDLSSNRLSGPIPFELSGLVNLRLLNLGFNDLSGPIPPELGGLVNLRLLDLRFNDLSGPIPSQLSSMNSLQTLILNANDLSGPIPPELGGLANLKQLNLGNNDLSGSILSQLSSMNSLQTLILNANNLSGPIPPELGGLVNLRLLDLRFNDLSGPIPSQLSSMNSLQTLILNANDLSGPIPPELGGLANLKQLNLGNNDLSGPIPPELGNLNSLQLLDLTLNAAMSGTLPASLTNLIRLESFQAGGTDLCLSRNSAFLAWRSKLRSHWIAFCEHAKVDYILAQAVQSTAHPVPLVAGDKSLLRVFVTALGATGGHYPSVRAKFFLDGRETYEVTMPAATKPIPREVDLDDLTKSANAEIPGEVVRPGLEVVIEIDLENALDPALGIPKRIPDTGRAAVDVIEMPVLDLTVIPFLWRTDPDYTILQMAADMEANPQGHELLKATRTLLPVGEINVRAHEPVWTSSNIGYDVLRETDAIRVLEGDVGHYMGMMDFRYPAGVARIGGRVSASSPNKFVIAHEFGHNMSLEHAPCGSPFSTDISFPYADGAIGAWGYDFEHERLVEPGHADLMSYCNPKWISDYYFTKALRFRLVDEGEARAAMDAEVSRSLLLWGGVDSVGVPHLEPVFVVNAPAALPSTSGGHRITGRTDDGDELFSLDFTMLEVADGDGSSSFAFALPVHPVWKDKLASITLTGPGGSAILNGDTDFPMVILRNPQSGQVRGFLRDVPGEAMAASKIAVDALSSESGLEALFSRGLPGAEAYQR